ncbi:salicylate hydroxylase [Nemania abortiva]|nr:salicylate hydroxylase [Nemania abortiva]
MIRIAISGGGLAGASLAHALLQYSHLDVHIFESAAAFKEAGMAIGVTRNAITALELIGPSAVKCLERAGAVPMLGARFVVAQGEGRGSIVHTIDEGEGKRVTSIVHRAALLREFLAAVPPERMHASKRLERINRQDEGPITLYFTDGTSHECDILVGADGIHSTVRKLILGGNDPAASPKSTGWWAVMALKPYKEAQACIGKGLIDVEDAREYSWIGDGAFLLHNVLEHGQLVQLALSTRDEEYDDASDQWQRPVSADTIRTLYKDFPPHLNKAVNELLCDKSEQQAIYLWEHLPAHTYVSGAVCIMGDAAHATTPWQGSGGGMSLEDSLILSTLLGRARSCAAALIALKVYDQVRRPHTQRVVESSRVTGEILTGRGVGIGLDVEKLKESLSTRWDFILNSDNGKQRDDALEMMAERLSREDSTT